jgi:hypothetical protein
LRQFNVPRLLVGPTLPLLLSLCLNRLNQPDLK